MEQKEKARKTDAENCCRLPAGILHIGGGEAAAFLQRTITNDIHKLDDPACPSLYAGLLTPQGKILFAFFVLKDWQDAGGFYLLTTPGRLEALLEKMNLYRLGGDISLRDKTEEKSLQVFWGSNARAHAEEFVSGENVLFTDPRLSDLGVYVFGERGEQARARNLSLEDAWRERCRSFGVAGGEDIAWGEDFPTEIYMDKLHGIDFEKGCFIGQEVLSRMKRRGKIRARLFLMTGGEDSRVKEGAEILADGRRVGVVRHSGRRGLAIMRADRLEDALEAGHVIEAGGAPLDLRPPEWTKD